jgi:hypothetical protein
MATAELSKHIGALPLEEVAMEGTLLVPCPSQMATAELSKHIGVLPLKEVAEAVAPQRGGGEGGGTPEHIVLPVVEVGAVFRVLRHGLETLERLQ